MDNPTIAYEVTVYLSNEELHSLLYTTLWPHMKNASLDQNWWRRRAEYLTSYSFSSYPGAWSDVYLYLEKYGPLFVNQDEDYSSLLVRVLLDLGSDPSVYSGHTLVRAVSRGYAEVVELLLVDGRVKGHPSSLNIAMRSAIDLGHTDIILVLLADKSIYPLTTYGTILVESLTQGESAIARRMRELVTH